MLAGASAVSVGTGNFISPDVSIKIIEEIEDYMKKYNIEDINSIVGTSTNELKLHVRSYKRNAKMKIFHKILKIGIKCSIMKILR